MTSTNLTHKDGTSTTVKCLTLKQPWAWAIFNLGKDIENRTWNTKYRGLLYIHAGKQFDKLAKSWIEEKFGVVVPENLETGCIVGSVQVTDTNLDSFDNPWSMTDQWHWKLENPLLLETPIPTKGRLGLWDFTTSEQPLLERSPENQSNPYESQKENTSVEGIMTTYYDKEDGFSNLTKPSNHYDIEDGYANPTKHSSNSSRIYHGHSRGRWIRYNNIHHPCPVCGGERKDCRSNGELYFCRTENPSRNFEYKGDSAIGFPMYVRRETPAYSPRSEKITYSPEQKKYSPISDSDRAKEFKKVVKQLGLSTPHKKQIERRGLTPELIEKYQFKSVDYATELIIPVSSGMPLKYGRKFNAKDSSIFIPVWQGNQILGAQLRPNDTSQMKYYWLRAGEATSHLETEEMPLACIIPEKINQVGVGLCESVGFKPIITAERLGRVMIGAAGGNFVGSSKQLLRLLNNNHPDKSIPVILYPDAGANENGLVLSQYENLKLFLEKNGYILEVAWWEQWQKETSKDIDDYLVSGGNEIKIIDWKQYNFYYRRTKGIYKKSRKFTPNIRIDERFLPKGIISKNIKGKTIIALKSAMGTGKTERLKDVTELIGGKHGLLMLGCRNSTLIQSCERLNIYHLRNDDAALHMKDGYGLIANCVDSLPRWENEWLENKVIIIDEISSVIPHLLAGATCKRQRLSILEKYVYAIRNAHCIILLDANAKNWEVNYIQKISQFENVIKIQNDYKPEPWEVEFVTDDISDEENNEKSTKTTDDFHPLISPIIDNNNPIVITTDSQRQAESIHNILGFETKGILRIDSKTINDEIQQKFKINPDNCIRQHGIKILIYSPSIDAGVDIKIKNYFTDVYAFFFHLPTDQAMQMLGRVRDSKCIRHIWCKKYSKTDSTLLDSSFKKMVADYLHNNTKEDLKNMLKNNPELNHILSVLDKIIDNSFDVHNDTYCQLKAQQNYEKKNLRETLKDRLIESGHNINEVVLGADKAIKEKYSIARTEVIKKNAREIMDAAPIDLREADEILSSWTASYPDRVRAEKAVFTKRILPGIEKLDLWSVELIEKVILTDKQCLTRLSLRWHYENPGKSQLIRQQSWLKASEREKVYLPDWRSPSLIAEKFRDIGIEKLLNSPNKAWTGKDSLIVEICKKANHYKRRAYFPKKGKMENIQYLNKILKRLGYKLHGKKNKGTRFYKLEDTYKYLTIVADGGFSRHEFSAPIMQILDQKLTSKAEDVQIHTEEYLQQKAAPPIYINKTGQEELTQPFSPPGIPSVSQPRLKLDDWVDITTDKVHEICHVVHALETSVIAISKQTGRTFKFGFDCITRIFRKGCDGYALIWSV